MSTLRQCLDQIKKLEITRLSELSKSDKITDESQIKTSLCMAYFLDL